MSYSPFPTRSASKSANSVQADLVGDSGLSAPQPVPELFSLSAVKAAQHNLVTSLLEVSGPQGIHIALALFPVSLQHEAGLLGYSSLSSSLSIEALACHVPRPFPTASFRASDHTSNKPGVTADTDPAADKTGSSS